MIIKPLHAKSPEGQKAIAALLTRFETGDDSCAQTVAEILEAVKSGGDDALMFYWVRYPLDCYPGQRHGWPLYAICQLFERRTGIRTKPTITILQHLSLKLFQKEI